MVLDENALEAMLARQRAAESKQSDPQETVTTDQTDEYEVYERKDEPAPAAEPEQEDPPEDDFEVFGESEEADDAAEPAPEAGRSEPAPEPLAMPAPGTEKAERPEHAEPASDLDEPTATGPQPTATPETVEEAMPEAFQVEKKPESERRRPQVWPPMSGSKTGAKPERATAPEPVTARERAPDHAPGAMEPAGDGEEPRAADEPTASVEPRSHNPMAHSHPPATASGSGCRLAIVQATFNAEITDMMAQLATRRAEKAGAEVVEHVTVLGVYDLPLAAQRLLSRDDVDAVVVIGCVVKGETSHDELITNATAKTLQEVSLALDKPIGFGVIGPGMTWKQAEARVVNGKHAVEAALAQWKALVR